MKRILLGDSRETLLSTLEIIIKHWGYRVLAAPRPGQLLGFLQDAPPDLVVLGSNFLAEADSAFRDLLARQVEEHRLPLILLKGDNAIACDLPHAELEIPINIFRLFTLIQSFLEATPRRNLRLKVQLPGMFYADDTPCLAEVLSLSMHGLFIKTGCRVDTLDRMRVIFPLLGMHSEVEIEGRVIYRVHPGPENNYMQGVGIEFVDLSTQTLNALEDFIESRLLGEIADSRSGARDLDISQLRVHNRDLPLRLAPLSPEEK